MIDFTPKHRISTEPAFREVHFSASGLWDADKAEALLKELYHASLPFIEDGAKFRVLGDLREFQVQDSKVADVMRRSQEGSAKLGVERMAIIYSSVLVKFQFRRISETINLSLFEEKSDALRWLRLEA